MVKVSNNLVEFIEKSHNLSNELKVLLIQSFIPCWHYFHLLLSLFTHNSHVFVINE